MVDLLPVVFTAEDLKAMMDSIAGISKTILNLLDVIETAIGPVNDALEPLGLKYVLTYRAIKKLRERKHDGTS